MSVHRAVTYSTRAHADIAGIKVYTQREWGNEQWIAYRHALTAGFDRIAAFPELGEMQSGLEPGIRAIRIEMHVVYYRVTPKTIRILRIRHVRATPLANEDL